MGIKTIYFTDSRWCFPFGNNPVSQRYFAVFIFLIYAFFFRGGVGRRPGGFVLFWGLFVCVFTAWTITNRESLCRPLLNPAAVR